MKEQIGFRGIIIHEINDHEYYDMIIRSVVTFSLALGLWACSDIQEVQRSPVVEATTVAVAADVDRVIPNGVAYVATRLEALDETELESLAAALGAEVAPSPCEECRASSGIVRVDSVHLQSEGRISVWLTLARYQPDQYGERILYTLVKKGNGWRLEASQTQSVN